MNAPYTIECGVQWRRRGLGGRRILRTAQEPAPAAHLTKRIPRLARLMALALRLEKLLASGVVKDFRTLARLGHVSPARISQIIGLLHLAPDIQEALLLRNGPERGRDRLSLRKVLPLTRVWEWHKQRRLWRDLSKPQAGLVATRRQGAGRIPPPVKQINGVRIIFSGYRGGLETSRTVVNSPENPGKTRVRRTAS